MTQQTPETPSGTDVTKRDPLIVVAEILALRPSALPLVEELLALREAAIRMEERTMVAQLLEAARAVYDEAEPDADGIPADYPRSHQWQALGASIAAFDVEKDAK